MISKVIYGLRKCTAVCASLHMMSVEPVIGIIKEVMGFRQFSLRGLVGAAFPPRC